MSQASPVNSGASASTGAYVMFRVGGHSLAMASNHVQTIHDELSIQAVGDTKSWFLGIAVADGALVPVTDLGRYLQLAQASGRTLGISPDVAVGALRVDEVLGVDDTAAKKMDAALPPALQDNAGLFSYALDASTGEHWVLDTPRLMQSPRFIDIAASAAGGDAANTNKAEVNA